VPAWSPRDGMAQDASTPSRCYSGALYAVCFSCRVLNPSRWRAELALALPTGSHRPRIYDEADGSSLVVVDCLSPTTAIAFKSQLEGWPFSWAEPDGPRPCVVRRADDSRGSGGTSAFAD
jgi:hypothetical protein